MLENAREFPELKAQLCVQAGGAAPSAPVHRVQLCAQAAARRRRQDPGNYREALREALADEAEGADIMMVKPGLPYLDIIRLLRDNSALPIAAYHVSGAPARLLCSRSERCLRAVRGHARAQRAKRARLEPRRSQAAAPGAQRWHGAHAPRLDGV